MVVNKTVKPSKPNYHIMFKLLLMRFVRLPIFLINSQQVCYNAFRDIKLNLLCVAHKSICILFKFRINLMSIY